MNDELYRQNILDHYKYPHHKGVLSQPVLSKRSVNRNCGDDLVLFLKIANGKIEDASFDGTGCAISTAGASMLTDRLIGLSVSEAKRLGESDVYDLFGIPIGPGRAKCALLAFRSLREILDGDE
jgi:nitrogen fixation NifU-like protein